MEQPANDKFLKSALVKAYSARASLFHRGIAKARLRELFKAVDNLDSVPDKWNLNDLGISEAAFAAISGKKILPHKVFAHPQVLVARPGLIAYYRNLVAVPQKGMSLMGLGTGRYERNPKSKMEPGFALALCRALNNIISSVIEALPDFALSVGRDVAFAELGTELQGTWANQVGNGAARIVEEILGRHIAENGLGSQDAKGRFALKNGWKICFGSEPDILFTDGQGVERIAVEIKGSLDKAGAQTRYGEAKKSFAKALARNPRCHTIYLASCFTDSVMNQVKADGQVRETFNLTSIIHDPVEQEKFLRKLFHVVNTPQ